MVEVLDKVIIKAISNETRQDIIKMLSKRPYTASEISKITKKHVTTISEHLNVLEKAGLVKKKESKNKWVYYELTDKGEHIFKPQIYSFVIVFALSAALIFAGLLRIFYFSYDAPFHSEPYQISVPLAKISTGEIQSEKSFDIKESDSVGYMLIFSGTALFISYVFYRNHKKK